MKNVQGPITVETISGAAGGATREAIVNLRVECYADSVEAVRRHVAAGADNLDSLVAMLASAVDYIVRSEAHRGCMNLREIDAEVARIKRDVWEFRKAHNSCDPGVEFKLHDALELLGKVRG